MSAWEKKTIKAMKSHIKETNSHYNSSLILPGPQDVFPTVLPVLPRNKINLLEGLAQREAQNFILTLSVYGVQKTMPPASRERRNGEQGESFIER